MCKVISGDVLMFEIFSPHLVEAAEFMESELGTVDTGRVLDGLGEDNFIDVLFEIGDHDSLEDKRLTVEGAWIAANRP